MNLSASVDHRLADGANAARFLVTMKRLLENPGCWRSDVAAVSRRDGTSTTTSEGTARGGSLIDEDGVPEVELRNYADGWLRACSCTCCACAASTSACSSSQRAGRIGFVGSMLGPGGGDRSARRAALEPRDWLWSGLREGGAALMRGLPLSEYVAQMYCNSNDTAKGRQMCNHFQHQAIALPELVVGDRHADPARRRRGLRGASSASATRCTRSTSATAPRARTASTRAELRRACGRCRACSCASTTAGRSRCRAASRPRSRLRRRRRSRYGMPGVRGRRQRRARLLRAHARAASCTRARAPVRRCWCVKTYRMLGHSSSRRSDAATATRPRSRSGRSAIRSALRALPRSARRARGRRARSSSRPGSTPRSTASCTSRRPRRRCRCARWSRTSTPRSRATCAASTTSSSAIAERHGEARKGDGAFPCADCTAIP